MQGLPATQTVLPQAQGLTPDATGASPCCEMPGSDAFSKVLNTHISERFSAKTVMAEMALELKADAAPGAGDAGLMPGAQPVVDVSRLAELLAQMAGGQQMKQPAQAVAGQGGENASGMDSADPADLRSSGKGAATFAADGRFLPVVERQPASGLPAKAQEAVPDFAQALAVHGVEHGNRPETLAMVQARHDTLELRQTSQPQVVEPRVGTPQWDGAVGQKVVWLIGQNQQSADLHLNPPHLGPLEVRLNLASDGQASVQFVSQHPVVREALESAIPRLREMMADNGIALGNVQVGAESFSRQEQTGEGQPHGRGDQKSEASEEILTPLNRPFERNSLGMLDLFA